MAWQLHVMVLLCLSALTSCDQPKIVIIGAGASGIAAASKLFENGFQNVTILEAENRIGGRVYTTRFDDSWIDVGGQWVHGQANNIVYELASPLGLLEVPPENTDLNFTIYDSQGRQVSTSIGNNLVKALFDREDYLAEDLNGNNGSIGEYYTGIVTAELLGKNPSINESLMGELLKLGDTITRAEDASDSWFETSARGYIEYWHCSGSLAVNWKDRGYGTILDILMKKYPNPEEELPVMNNTLLNSEVVNINYNSTGGKVVVETSDGKQFTADHVITTPSLGVLKENYQTLFTPQLPESKIKTIQGLAFGTVGKIFLSFETPWWSENTNFGLIWESNDRLEFENDPDKKWLLDVNMFSLVVHRPQIICAWVSGASVRHMESLTEEQVFNQTLAHVHRFFGKSYNITRSTGMLRSQWHANKHFRGSYSYRSMETEEADVWADGLAAPILVDRKPVVMFAGEATHPHYYSTVHGAIQSGFREATRIIDIHKTKG